MTESLYLKCLDELRLINYSEYIEFNGFNEPLVDRELFLQRVCQLKMALPDCKLVINTNGDFLDPEYFVKIAESGVDFMVITLHLNLSEQNLTANERYAKTEAFRQRFPEINFFTRLEPNSFIANIGKMKISLRVADYFTNGHNWGGMINEKKRRGSPCFVPVKQIYIDYLGRVCLCCSINMDIYSSGDFLLGNAARADLFDLYSSPLAQRIRNSLIEMSEDIPKCCEFCDAQLSYIDNYETINNPYPGLFD